MNHEIRLPGYGGAGFFLRRTIGGDPPIRAAVDVWLLGPDFLEARFGRVTAPPFLSDLARWLYAVAESNLPEQQVAAFADASAGMSIDVVGSDDARVNLSISVAELDDGQMLDPLAVNFEVSRAAMVDTAYRVAQIAGGVDLADFKAVP